MLMKMYRVIWILSSFRYLLSLAFIENFAWHQLNKTRQLVYSAASFLKNLRIPLFGGQKRATAKFVCPVQPGEW